MPDYNMIFIQRNTGLYTKWRRLDFNIFMYTLGSSQLDFFLGGMGSLILYIYFLGLFLKVKVQNWRMLYVKYFWGIPDVPDIFLEVNSR